jgi:hypothetical protein
MIKKQDNQQDKKQREKEYREAHKEHYNELKLKWYYENKDKAKKSQSAWLERNIEKVKAYQRLYQKNYRKKSNE